MVDYGTNFSASQKLLAFHENLDIIYLERLRERDGKKREREREREIEILVVCNNQIVHFKTHQKFG